MRLEQIQWRRQNKTAERSQILYQGEILYLLIRIERQTKSGVPVVPASYSYVTLRHGSETEWSGDDPTAILDNLWPHKMTPLELKCWRMEQKQ